MRPHAIVGGRLAAQRNWNLGFVLAVPLIVLSCFPAAAADEARGEDGSETPTTSQLHEPDLGTVSLEDLMEIKVYSASRYLQNQSEAPGTITIITRTEIERYGYRTLADALRSVPGLFVTYDRQYSYLGVRGFANPGDYNTRILLMIDGHRLNDAIFEQAMLGTEFPVDIDLIERIEVIRGPAASIYGTNAVFGVVNVITRDTSALRGLELSADAASFQSYRGRVSYGGKILGIATVLSGTFYGSKGANELFFPEYVSADGGDGIARGVDNDRFTDFLATLTAKGFTLQSIYGRRNKADPTAAWDTVFNDPRNHSVDIHAFTDLQYERNLGKNWSVTGRTYYDRYEYGGFFSMVAADAGNVLLNRDVMRGEQWGLQTQVSRTLQGKHRLIAGFEYRDNFRQQLLNFNVDPASVLQNVDRPNWIAAEYLQGEFEVNQRLHLTAGLRNDYDERIGSSVNPRISAAFRPWSNGTLKLTYGTAFRSPNAYELYYAGEGSMPALHLEPEHIQAWEGGLEQKVGGGVSISATFFRNQMHDFLAYTKDPSGLLTFRNINRAVSTGAEFSLSAKGSNGLLATASYSFQRAQDTIASEWLVGSPRHMVQANVSSLLFHSGVIGGLELQYLSSRPTLAGREAPPYAVLNATLLRKNLGGRLDLSASVYNLLNTAFYDPGAQQHLQDTLQQPGRTFRLKLTVRLGAE